MEIFKVRHWATLTSALHMDILACEARISNQKVFQKLINNMKR